MSEHITEQTYYDKVLGGWVGKCAGGILGAPIEGFKVFNRIAMSDELFASNFANDDLDLQVLWLDMVAKKGAHVREADFAEQWLEHVEFPWNEYGIAYRNLRLGLDIPDSGRHNNWYWGESMGSPIRSEIWGMLFPGDPARAAEFARIDSQLDHDGFSVGAEQLFSACAALAFVIDEPREALEQAMAHVTVGGGCLELMQQIMTWYDAFGFETTAAKIKSKYGDADFTSAPMNVGFTILSVLHAGRAFDGIIEALYLGHDSDCVVATTGAILGIARGFEQIPETWRRRVGNELLISPEIVGLDLPTTLTELATRTCDAGRAIKAGGPSPKPYAFHATVERFPDVAAGKAPELLLHFENLSETTLDIDFEVDAEQFGKARGQLRLAASSKDTTAITLHDATSTTLPHEPKHSYSVRVTAGGKSHTYHKGIPSYGSWLLVGPFIEADPVLIPMNKVYPDHGMSSLPSVQYMNHDRTNTADKDFVDHATLHDLVLGNNRAGRPYGVEVVYPNSMTIELGEHFGGRGERTLYLTSQLFSKTAARKWLCLGTTAMASLWVNGERLLAQPPIRRRWPSTYAVELALLKGANTITIRLDTVTDDYVLDVGLKDHTGKHYHQSQWDAESLFSVPR